MIRPDRSSANDVTASPARAGRRLAALAIALLVPALAACGGGGDDESAESTTTTIASSVVSPTVAQPTPTATITVAPIAVPTTVAYVTAGASVMVANASRVDGGAGRLTERLTAVGFTTVAPGNYTLGQIETTIIYYDPTNAAAKAVADSLRLGLGGGNIQVLEIVTPPPVDSGTLGGAHVLVAMGNDTADKSLEVLQGITTTAAPTTTEASSTAGDSTTDASATGESSTDQ